jgi:hypothetical protein
VPAAELPGGVYAMRSAEGKEIVKIGYAPTLWTRKRGAERDYGATCPALRAGISFWPSPCSAGSWPRSSFSPWSSGCSASSRGYVVAGVAGMAAVVVAYVLATVLFVPGAILTLGAGLAYGVALGAPIVSPTLTA